VLAAGSMQYRHGVTFGANTGTNGNGIQRSVTVSNCVSMQTDTSHYDTHQPCEVSFVNCAAIGGMPSGGSGAAVGFQSRGKKRHNLRLCDQGHCRTGDHALRCRINGDNRYG
jgi:hypothetical protein